MIYQDQVASVVLGGSVFDFFPVGRGVHQDRPGTPLLFNIRLEVNLIRAKVSNSRNSKQMFSEDFYQL